MNNLPKARIMVLPWCNQTLLPSYKTYGQA